MVRFTENRYRAREGEESAIPAFVMKDLRLANPIALTITPEVIASPPQFPNIVIPPSNEFSPNRAGS